MSNAEQKPDNLQKTDISKSLLRLMGIMVLLDVSALVAGISFFMIVHGALLGIRWSAPYWKFSRNIFVKASGFPETNILLNKNQITWWQGINLLLKAVTVVALLILGLWILVRNGFCGQNFICLANQ
jgi:hypothetical protein